MYKIPCRCGKTSKNFKFKIGDTFRAPCCFGEKPETAKPPTKTEDVARNVADLNDDGVVDAKDAAILLAEMGKSSPSYPEAPKTEEDILSFLDED